MEPAATLAQLASVVSAHKATIVEADLDATPRPWPPDFGDVDPIEFLDEQLHRVIEVLRTRSPEVGAWTSSEVATTTQ